MPPRKKKTFAQIIGRHPARPAAARPHPYGRHSPRRASPRPVSPTEPLLPRFTRVKFTPEGSHKRLHGYATTINRALSDDAAAAATDPHKYHQQLLTVLGYLSHYTFHSATEPNTTGVFDAVKALSRSNSGLAPTAAELLARWESGDLSPRLLSYFPAEPSPTPEPDYDDYDGNDDGDDDGDGELSNQLLFRNIVRRKTASGRRSFLTISPPEARRPANVFGHNGLAPGTWWPLQVCARRDGAHGASVAGIYGALADGAYSVIAAGGVGYEASDRDAGDVLLYSGSNGEGLTKDTRKLIRSCETRREVRVLRGKGAGSWAPAVGLRYDGLYVVKEYYLVANGQGGEFYQFRLERCGGQEALESIREKYPTKEERAAYARYKS